MLSGNVVFDFGGVENKSYPVLVVKSHEAEKSYHLCHDLTSGEKLSSIGRMADIEDKINSKLSFFNELFYIGLLHSGCYIPVNVTDIISIGVFSNIGEFYTFAFEYTVVLACELILDEFSGTDFKVFDTRDDLLDGLRKGEIRLFHRATPREWILWRSSWLGCNGHHLHRSEGRNQRA